MNNKVIYVDFSLRKKRLTSKKIPFYNNVIIKIKYLFSSLNQKKYNNTKVYEFKKIL